MSADLWEPIIGVGTVLLVILTTVLIVGKDACVNYLKKLGRRIKNRLTVDRSSAVLSIPAPRASYTPAFPHQAVPTDTLHGELVKFVIGGGRKLLAYRTARGTHLVEYHRPNEHIRSIETSKPAEANERWREWYLDWKNQPCGFGGSFGSGLDDKQPF